RSRLAQGAREEAEGEGDERDHEAVGAGLLREPDEVRVEGDERGSNEAGAARGELPPGQVGGGDRKRAEGGAQRAQADDPGPEGARPRPRGEVVEGRRALAADDGRERRGEARVDDVDRGEGLVVVQALGAERG